MKTIKQLFRGDHLFGIIAIGFSIRCYTWLASMNTSHYSDIDEVEAYIWGYQLLYFSHAKFFTYLLGPWQNIIAFLSSEMFNSVNGMYYLWIGIGTLEIYLIYWFLRKTNLKKKAWLGALICAVFPWPIQYTNSFWNPYFLIPLTTIALGCLLEIEKSSRDAQPNKRAIFGFIISYALMPFFHMISLFSVPIVLFFLFKYRRGIHFPTLFVSLIFSIPLYLPALYMDMKNGWPILGGYVNLSNESDFFLSPEAFKVFSNLIVVNSLEVSRFIGNSFIEYKIYLNRFFGHYVIGLTFIVPSLFLSVFGYIYMGKIIFQSKTNLHHDHAIIKLFVFFILGTAICFGLTGRPSQLRYMVIFWPIFFYIQVLVLNHFWSYRKWTRIWSIFHVVIGLYISITIPLHYRLDTPTGKIQLLQSLAHSEKIQNAIIDHIGINYFHRPRVAIKLTNQLIAINHNQSKWLDLSFLSLFPSLNKDVQQIPVKVFIDFSYLDREINPKRTDKSLENLKRWIHFNNWIEIIDNQSDAQASFILIPKNKKNSLPSTKTIAILPNAILAVIVNDSR